MPVTATLLTGFLGSGKTTLLRRLLRQPELRDTAVLINEFGEVGLDHLLIEEVSGDIVLLKSGCVCCTVRGDVKDALLRLDARRAAGEVPAFSRLVIETSGLADPAPLVATLIADPMLRHHFRMGRIVTVVDGVNGAATLDAYPESVGQVAAADRLMISKADLVDGEALTGLEERLARLNPTAAILPSSDDSELPEALLEDAPDGKARLAEVRRWLAADAGHHHDHDDGSRHGDVRSFVLEAEEPLDWAAFGLWLSMLLNRHGRSILRLKGLLQVAGVESPVVVQGVQHVVHRPTHLARWPDGVPRTRLVVIGRDIDPAAVRRSFASFMRLGASDAW